MLSLSLLQAGKVKRLELAALGIRQRLRRNWSDLLIEW